MKITALNVVFDPVSKRVVTSKDVVFEEDNQLERDANYKKQVLLDPEWGDYESNT